MAYKGAIMVDDETLFRTMLVARDTGGRVMVHAENGDAIAVLIEQALRDGHTDPAWHARTRPPLTEAEATTRAILLGRLAGAPLYVVHVSCREALEAVSTAKTAGWNVIAETCTQYLYIDETFLARPDFEGAKYVFTPPPRTPDDHLALWGALANDTVSVVSSDHAPFRWRDQKALGRDDFSKIPNGAPGVEERLQLIHHLGVVSKRISLNRFVEVVSTNPAKVFGLFPKKGTIAVGSDADIVIWNPGARRTMSAETHHSKVDYNLFDGVEVHGCPSSVVLRGNVIVSNGELLGRPGVGKFVARQRVGLD